MIEELTVDFPGNANLPIGGLAKRQSVDWRSQVPTIQIRRNSFPR